jgi:hypothetical protein
MGTYGTWGASGATGYRKRATELLWWPVLVGSAGSPKEGMREQESSGTDGGGRHGGDGADLCSNYESLGVSLALVEGSGLR